MAPVQEAQMTTVLDSNVHNVSVTGSFDDCQTMVCGYKNVNTATYAANLNCNQGQNSL